MRPSASDFPHVASVLLLISIVPSSTPTRAQDISFHSIYICSGERLYVEACSTRDHSDVANCMVAHPGRAQNGIMAYTNETRGTLRQLLLSCQPASSAPNTSGAGTAQALEGRHVDPSPAPQQAASRFTSGPAPESNSLPPTYDRAATDPSTLAVLSIESALSGTPNPLAGRPLILLRDSYPDALRKAGINIPPGVSPYAYMGSACSEHSPNCQRIMEAIRSSAAAATHARPDGSGSLPGIPPGTYFLMISTHFNHQAIVWDQPVQLHAGLNAMTLSRTNATPVE